MKNLKKMLAILAASAVMCAAVPAFAEVELSKEAFDQDSAVTAFNFEYDEEDEVYKIGVEISTEVAIADEEMTFLILDNDVTNDDILAGNVDEEDILYIDQKTLKASDNTFEAAINLKLVNGAVTIVDDEEVVATEMPEGNYPVLVGYYYMQDDVKTFGRAVATAVVEEVESGIEVTFLWGDITGDTYIDSEDALAALLQLAGTTTQYTVSDQTAVVGSQFAGYLWGDITGDTYIDSEDALAALLQLAGTTTQYTVNGKTTAVGEVIHATIEQN